MFEYNQKLVLKIDGEYIPVTVDVQSKRIAKGKVMVSPCVGESFRVSETDLITLEEYTAIKAAIAAPAAPINLANPQEFTDSLAKLDNAAAIKDLCDRLCKRLFTEGQEYTPKSRSNKLAPYSKLVKELPVLEGVTGFYQVKQDGSQWLRHLYYKYTGIADTNWQEINQKASEKVIENLADQKPLDAQRYEECVNKLLASKSVWEIGAGLIAASGRRPIEIVIDGEFEIEGNGLKFSGQAKKRDEIFEDYCIPLISCTPKLFIESLTKFRKSYQVQNHIAKVKAGKFEKGKEADNIRVQINRLGINPALNWIPVSDSKSNPTCSDLRAAWIAIVESKFKDDSKYSLLYRSEVLGHELNVGSIPALNYSRYVVVEPKPDFVADLREVEVVVAEWEKEEIATEEVPVFQVDDRVMWCNIPAIVFDIRVRNCGVGYDYFLKNDGGRHWSGWSQGMNELVARVDEAKVDEVIVDSQQFDSQQRTTIADLLPQESEILAEQTQLIALPPKELRIDSNSTITPDISGRHALDFYETPPWLTLLALANVPLSGTIGECCVGHGAIASIVQMAGLKVWTNDIDPAKPADYHSNATLPESWEQLPPADWIVTNPPYADMSAPIVKNAYAHASRGIVMILRQNWIEGCDDRRAFLKAHPPTLAISVPRYCYRKGKPDKNGVSRWATDQCPTWIYVWEKANRSGLTKILTLGADEIPLFHRTPESIPSVEAIEAEVQRIMANKPVEEADRITQIMLNFLEQNNVSAKPVYVSQTVVKKLCGVGNDKANLWINQYKELLAKHNAGRNPFGSEQRIAMQSL
jgi:hypothetical protein